MQTTVAAILDKVTTLRDGSVKLSFETQEIDAQNCTTLMQMRNQIGWLVFAPSDEKAVVVPDQPPSDFKEAKTPSQRLRGVLFVKWQQEGLQGDFESYYRRRMEDFIESEKLDLKY